MEKKIFRLRFREKDRDIFEAIRDNRKTIETRAAMIRYRDIKKGDCVMLVCGKDVFEKSVANARIFKSIDSLLKKYKVKQINPNIETEEELKKMYKSFTAYREKIKKYGIITLELGDHEI